MTRVSVRSTSPPSQAGRRLAFRRLELPAETIAAEKIPADLREIAAGLFLLHLHLHEEGRRDEASLAAVLWRSLERQRDALKVLLDQGERP